MPLTIIVVGAGLAGLATALALGQNGHKVKIFEQSSFSNEVGAAIHVPPNATRLLRRWRLPLEDLESVKCTRLRIWNDKEQYISTPATTSTIQAKTGNTNDWLLVHRVDLHNLLRQAVQQNPATEFFLSSRVTSVDYEKGAILLADGSRHEADLIVGADGIHSKAVEEIIGEPSILVTTAQNCFRFLIPTAKVRANPITADFISKVAIDGLDSFSSHDRRIVIYPCRNGELLNLVAIHPAAESSKVEESSWLTAGSIKELQRVYKDFGPNLRELCAMAEDLKLWELSSRAPILTFAKGKLALVGDAAHPTLPHQGQGAAQGFEDAAALATLLDEKTKPEDVPGRLQLYNKIRYPRALTVMFMSMVHEEKRDTLMERLRKFVPDAQYPESMFEYTWLSDPVYEGHVALQSIATVTSSLVQR